MPDFDFQIALDRLAESLMPDEDIRQQKANAVVISQDGGVHSRPLMNSLPWYRADVSMPGNAVAESDVRRVAFPQGGTIRHVSMHARTAPSTMFNIRLSSSTDSQRFSLRSNATMSGANIDVDAGDWVVLSVTNAGGAADIEITLHYTPRTGGA